MTATEHLLILGASARAASFSALRAALRPWCIDLFADLDLQARCPVQRLTGRYPHSFRDHIDAAPPAPWIYTGGLENWPRLVQRLMDHRALWGNSAPSLKRARDPIFVTDLLQTAGMPAPRICRPGEQADQTARWLSKPRKGAGGSDIHFADETTDRGRDAYLQEYIEGTACSLLYLGDGRHARLLGMTWQLIGVPFLHARPFRYCGSIGPANPITVRRPSLAALGDLLAGACELRGLFGIDGVLREEVFWPVEINPRYTASIEVLEYAAGLAALAHHAHVFTHGTLPPPAPPVVSEKSVGKAILFGQADLIFPTEGPWLTELQNPSPVNDLPMFADIPAAGQPIEAGRPILTFFARAATTAACMDELRRIAADLDRRLFKR